MASINRGAIFYDNLVPAATLTATSEASTSTDVDKLKTFRPKQKWRSSGIGDQTILVTLSEIKSVFAVFLWRHNLTAEATVRIRLADNNGLTSPVYDNTFYAWPSTIGFSEGGFNENGFGGVPLVDELEEEEKYSAFFLDLVFEGTLTGGANGSCTLPSSITKQTGGVELIRENINVLQFARITITGGTGSGQSKTITAIDPSTLIATVDSNWSVNPDNTSTFEIDLLNAETYTANDGSYAELYVGITISDSTNADGYFEAGWLGVGQYSQFDYDISADIPDEFVDPSNIFTAYDQSLWATQKRPYRMKSVTWPALSESEAKNNIKEIGRKVGRARPVVILPFVENSARLYNDSVFGLLANNPNYKQVRRKYDGYSYECEMTVREQI